MRISFDFSKRDNEMTCSHQGNSSAYMDLLSNWLWNQTQTYQHPLMLTFPLTWLLSCSVAAVSLIYLQSIAEFWLMTNDSAVYVMKINEPMCSFLWSIRLLKTTANSISLQLNTIKFMDWGQSVCFVAYPLLIGVFWWVVLVFFNLMKFKGTETP